MNSTSFGIMIIRAGTVFYKVLIYKRGSIDCTGCVKNSEGVIIIAAAEMFFIGALYKLRWFSKSSSCKEELIELHLDKGQT